MTTTPSMDILPWLRNLLSEAQPDLLREMVQEFAERPMGAEVDERMSKSQVSELAKSLDEMVEGVRTRPPDGGPEASVRAAAERLDDFIGTTLATEGTGMAPPLIDGSTEVGAAYTEEPADADG